VFREPWALVDNLNPFASRVKGLLRAPREARWQAAAPFLSIIPGESAVNVQH